MRAQNSLQLNNGPPQLVTIGTNSGPVAAAIGKSDSANSIISPQDTNLMSPPPHATDSGGSGSSPLPPPSAPPIPSPSSISPFAVAGSSAGNGKHLNKSISGDDSTNRSALLDSICNFNKSGLKKINVDGK